MLTLEQLDKMEAGVFKTGLTIDNYTGDKITSPADIQKLVPSNKEAFSRYRY